MKTDLRWTDQYRKNSTILLFCTTPTEIRMVQCSQSLPDRSPIQLNHGSSHIIILGEIMSTSLTMMLSQEVISGDRLVLHDGVRCRLQDLMIWKKGPLLLSTSQVITQHAQTQQIADCKKYSRTTARDGGKDCCFILNLMRAYSRFSRLNHQHFGHFPSNSRRI